MREKELGELLIGYLLRSAGANLIIAITTKSAPLALRLVGKYMGNSQLKDNWETIKASTPSPDLPCPIDLTFTSAETYTEYRVTRVINEDKGCYEASDSFGTLYHLKCMQIDSFSLVKTLHKRLNLIKLHQKALHTAVILDIIEEPPALSSPWVLAVVFYAEDCISLDKLLKGLQLEAGMRRFALEDVVEGLGRVLESVEVLHQIGLTAGPIRLDCLDVVAKGEFKLRVNYVECLEAAFEGEMSGKTEERTRESDMRDVGVVLLSVLLPQPIPSDPSMDFLISIPYPSLLKLYLIRLIKPISRLTDPAPILTSDTFLLLKQLLRREEIESVEPTEALVLVMALEFKRVEVGLRAFRLLMQLILRYPALCEDPVMREISPFDLSSILDNVDIEAESELIAPSFELLQSVVTTKGQLACKQAGFIRFFTRSLLAFSPSDRRFQGYLPALLSFCSTFDCKSCYYKLALRVFPTISASNPSADLKQYVLNTCHSCGDLSIGVITRLLEERVIAGPVDCIQLLFLVPCHLFRPMSVEVIKVLAGLLGTCDEAKIRFELVTEFLGYALQRMYIWSHYALKGLCFTVENEGVIRGVRPCGQGYECRSCNVQLCSTCVAYHYAHSVHYIGPVAKCKGTPVGPFMTKLNYHPTQQAVFTKTDTGKVMLSDCLRGVGRFESVFQTHNDRTGPESLDFYMEIQIRSGGDTDNVTISMGNLVSYCSQDGIIRITGEKDVPGPPQSAYDVVGLGFTSHSRVLFTFNGVPHTCRIYLPALHADPKAVITLEADSEVAVLPSKQHLFHPDIGLKSLPELLTYSSKAKLPRYFWSLYKKTLKRVVRQYPDSSYQVAGERFILNKDPHDLEVLHDHTCNCLLF